MNVISRNTDQIIRHVIGHNIRYYVDVGGKLWFLLLLKLMVVLRETITLKYIHSCVLCTLPRYKNGRGLGT